MNKKSLHIFLLLLLFATSAFADTTQTITINGETVEQVATKLTFNGDKVIITYSNGENSGEVDMESVVISFTTSTGIGAISTYQFNGIVDGTLNIGNIADGTPIVVYNTSGSIGASVKSSGNSAQIDINGQPSGIYLLKAGKQVVKFVKR